MRTKNKVSFQTTMDVTSNEDSNLSLHGFEKAETVNKITKRDDSQQQKQTKKRVVFLENNHEVEESIAEIVSEQQGIEKNEDPFILTDDVEDEQSKIAEDVATDFEDEKALDSNNIQDQVILEEDEDEVVESGELHLQQPFQLENYVSINKNLENLVNTSNNSSLFQSKIMDFSTSNRSQQRLSPIHINNRKYPIIDYMNDSNKQVNNSSFNILSDRSLIIASPSKNSPIKNHLVETVTETSQNTHGVLFTFFKAMQLDYFEELSEFLENDRDGLILDVSFFKQNSSIKLFISNEDLNTIKQEAIYLKLYTKTPMLEIDRFIVNELNSKLENSLTNFNKINTDYNDPQNKNKLPFLLKTFQTLKHDAYYFERLGNLLDVMKKNCDLEAKKIWLNWRVQQFDGISLVLRDNFLIVKEQQKELDLFKSRLEGIFNELAKIIELGDFKANFAKEKIVLVKGNFKHKNNFNYSLMTKATKQLNEDVFKWEKKRQKLMRKYDIDIGNIQDITKEKQKQIIADIQLVVSKNTEKQKKANIFSSEPKVITKSSNYLLLDQLKKHNLHGAKVVLRNSNNYQISVSTIPKTLFIVKFDENRETIENITIHSVADTSTDDKILVKLWIMNESSNIITTFGTFSEVDEKLSFLVKVSGWFRDLNIKYQELSNIQTLDIDENKGLMSFNIWLNNNMGHIKVVLDWTKFKEIAINDFNLLSEIENAKKAPSFYNNVGVYLFFYGKSFDWSMFLPKYVSKLFGWSA